MSVAGKTAIVTGAATGIGAATATLLAARGARVLAAGLQPERAARDRRRDRGGRRRGARDRGGRLRPGRRSRRSPRAPQEAFGGADILVNNAAIYPLGPWHEADAAEWDAVFATNVRGYFLLAKAVRPQMLARGGGAIVNVASVTFYWGEALLVVLRRVEGRGDRLHPLARPRGGARGHPRQRRRPGRVPDRRDRDPRRPGRAVGRTCSSAQSIKRRGEVEDVARAIAFFAGEDSRLRHAARRCWWTAAGCGADDHVVALHRRRRSAAA